MSETLNNSSNSPTAPDLMVRFAGVQKTYDGQSLIVKNLDLDIPKGEFVTLLGPSGSGKTTILMMLAGFETATQGEIFIKGKPVTSLPPHKRGLGLVFQNYALFPHMTVAENLAFPLAVRGLSKADQAQKVARALDMVALPQMGNRRPGQLSGGQQQRVAVARALVFEPDLVLMDEPLGALDRNLREQMQYEIRHLHERLGITMVYVTHDQGEALTLSSRIAVFNQGTIEQISGPADLYERPESSFVAHFIGENNRLAGHVEAIDSTGIATVRLRDGTAVRALAVRASTGADTLLSIRPERVDIEIGKGDKSQPHDVRLEARIEELIYLGDHVRVRVCVAGNSDFIIKVPNRDRAKPLERGQIVSLGWMARDCRALDARPGQA